MQSLRHAVSLRATTAGVLFGAFTLLTAGFSAGGLTTRQWLVAGAAAVTFGVVFGLVQARSYRQAQLRLFGTRLTTRERAAAIAAVQRAEPPRDPRLRAVADSVARTWTRGANSPLAVIGLFALLVAAGVAGALLVDRGMWAVVVVGAVVGPWMSVRMYLNRRGARGYLVLAGDQGDRTVRVRDGEQGPGGELAQHLGR